MNTNRNESSLLNVDHNDSLTGDFLWSSVNFSEAVTAPMTPLAWSVLEYSLEDWVFIPGFSTTGNISGRPYIDVSIFSSLFHALGRSRKQLLDSLEATLYMQLPDNVEIPLISLSRSKMPSILMNLSRIGFRQRQGVSRMSTYVSKNPAWFVCSRDRLQQIDAMEELVSFWNNEIGPHIKDGAWTVLGVVTYSADYTNRLR